MLGARGAKRAPAASLLRDGRACVRERELAREAHWPEMTQSARGAVRARAVSALPRTFARHRCALLDVSPKLQTRRAHVYARELQPIVASSSQKRTSRCEFLREDALARMLRLRLEEKTRWRSCCGCEWKLVEPRRNIATRAWPVARLALARSSFAEVFRTPCSALLAHQC